MAVRVVALLIPLAITLPQLRMSRPETPAPQSVAAAAPSVEEPAWSHESRRVSDATLTLVALDAPATETARTSESPAVVAGESATAAGVTPQLRKAPPRRAAPKLARAAPTNAAAQPGGPATRLAQRLPADAGCLPSVHCAPVVVAKVTPVVRRPM